MKFMMTTNRCNSDNSENKQRITYPIIALLLGWKSIIDYFTLHFAFSWRRTPRRFWGCWIVFFTISQIRPIRKLSAFALQNPISVYHLTSWGVVFSHLSVLGLHAWTTVTMNTSLVIEQLKVSELFAAAFSATLMPN